MTEDGGPPLSFATEGEILAELGRRYTSYVLVAEQPGARGSALTNFISWWGAPAARLGLVEYARRLIITDITEYAKAEYHGEQ